VTQPLRSFYSSPLAGNVGRANRAQEILTPDWLVGEARAALGGAIGLDPCASMYPENQIAGENWHLPAEIWELEAMAEDNTLSKALRDEIKATRKHMYLTGPGLVNAWTKPAYCNPPYEFLEPWLRVMREGSAPVVALVPVRPQRVWWCELLADVRGQFLKPFPFKHQKQSFPAPLCLMFFRCEPIRSSHCTREFCL
jgi:hypothetical protein